MKLNKANILHLFSLHVIYIIHIYVQVHRYLLFSVLGMEPMSLCMCSTIEPYPTQAYILMKGDKINPVLLINENKCSLNKKQWVNLDKPNPMSVGQGCTF